MRTFRWLLALILLAGAAGALWWRMVGRGPEVQAVSPRRGTVAEIVYATGVVEPERWAKVSPMNRKRVVDMCFCEGRDVRKGDVLAKLDDGEEKAGLAELEATRERRQRDLDRVRGLAARAAATQVAVDQAETALAEIDARVAAQKDRIDELTLRAPMDGQVLRRDGQIGEIVGQTDVLFWVGPPTPKRIVAEVNEEDILKVAIGQTALLRADALGEARVEAKVGAITPKGDPTSKTFRVYLPLPDDTPLRVGMSVEANIVAREKQNALVVPAEAVTGKTVFVIDGHQLRRREATIGLRGAKGVEILEGVGEADRLASPAKPEWKDGMRVRIAPAPDGKTPSEGATPSQSKTP
jgi:RND family efflux transporter MFP subunit